jgi:hypothetical protein
VIDYPKNQAECDADEQAGNQWKIKSGVLAAVNDIAGEPAEAEREFAAERQEGADGDEHCAEYEEGAAEVLEWLHRLILARRG